MCLIFTIILKQNYMIILDLKLTVHVKYNDDDVR